MSAMPANVKHALMPVTWLGVSPATYDAAARTRPSLRLTKRE
ncbi:hypothetical protein ACFQHO_29445 [Actinomadura yumaensis]